VALAIIGVVAALTIPSVLANINQHQYKTGFKKAIAALNSSIKTSYAIDGDSPYDTPDLSGYLKRHMNVMKSFNSGEIDVTKQFSGRHKNAKDFVPYKYENAGFYTTDGIIFEFPDDGLEDLPLYETKSVQVCRNSANSGCGGCGSLGINREDKTGMPPCLVVVDVNGERQLNAPYIATRTYASSNAKRFSDVFPVMITENDAIPYGTAAQKAMYELTSEDK